MRVRHTAVVVLSLLLTTSLAAIDRGNVFIENRTHAPTLAQPSRSHELWLHIGGGNAVAAGGFLLIHKMVPYAGEGHFLVPAPNQFVFHHERTVSHWDGVPTYYNLPGKGYVEIFTADTELGEIAPMRSGNFLVAERWNDPAKGTKLIEFNTRGKVAEYRFPTFVNAETNRAVGATHIELLRDQCTLLYTVGKDHPAGNHVFRLNLCTNQPLADFAALPRGEYAGAIRQLPNGDVLVASGNAVLQFTSEGSLLRTYFLPGVTHVALSADGTLFWAGGVHLERAFLRGFHSVSGLELINVQLGNDGMQTAIVPLETTDLVVVGEWRTAVAQAKTRGRAVRR